MSGSKFPLASSRVNPRRSPELDVLRASTQFSLVSQMAEDVMAQWQYQVRFDVDDTSASEAIRQNAPKFTQLFEVLARHRAVAKSQFVAFSDYVSTAEQEGIENYPLYAWTKATIENPAKKEKYLKSFTVYVDGHEVYDRGIADALESDLQSLPSELIVRVRKYDTNPANNPQPPKH
jgi:hypothetical protein